MSKEAETHQCHYKNSGNQQVKDLVLSLLWYGFHPWPWAKNKKVSRANKILFHSQKMQMNQNACYFYFFKGKF